MKLSALLLLLLLLSTAREENGIILLALGVCLSMRTYRSEAPLGKISSALCKQECLFLFSSSKQKR